MIFSGSQGIPVYYGKPKQKGWDRNNTTTGESMLTGSLQAVEIQPVPLVHMNSCISKAEPSRVGQHKIVFLV